MADLNVNSIGDASGGNTASINGYTPTMSNMAGRNRIINGDMRIDQRNAGASSTLISGYVTVDRWRSSTNNRTSVLTIQQNAGSVTPPVGFTNYLGITVTTEQASLSSDTAIRLVHRIEGFNTADLAFGTASASSVTLSFWVRSSITGLYGVYLTNSTSDRHYVASYTINTANTWEYKTITIPGDTMGTWFTNNEIGILVGFSLVAGTSRQTTPGSWVESDTEAPTGQTNLTETNGATWYITGVQLEAGSVATPFENVDYGEMLRRCQRYYYRWVATASTEPISTGYAYSTASTFILVPFPVPMRVRPAGLETTGTASDYRIVRAGPTIITCSNTPSYSNSSTTNGQVLASASGLTAGEGLLLHSNATGAFLGWSAEL